MARKTTTTTAAAKAATKSETEKPAETATEATEAKAATAAYEDKASTGTADAQDAKENTQGAAETAQTVESSEGSPAETAQAPAARDSGMVPGSTSDEEAKAITTELKDAEPKGAASEVTIVCHRPDGRRRAGRRWPSGASTVLVTDLTPFQLAQLQADPHFTVTKSDT